jgi:hypothetical protein
MTMALSSDGDNRGDDDPPASYQLGEHRIRLDFSYTDADTAPQCVDRAGDVIKLDNWPLQSTFKDRFSIQIVEARKPHIMAGFIIRSQSKFNFLKTTIRPVLPRLSVWLHPHPLAFTQLDMVPLGFIPLTHSPARISDDIHDIIFDNYHYLSKASNSKTTMLIILMTTTLLFRPL